MILTRYLFWKADVVDALEAAMRLKSNDAFFWAYELYYSGFEKETFDLLVRIYHTYFAPLNPTMITFLNKKAREGLKTTQDPKTVAVVVKNLLTRPTTADSKKGRNIYVLVEDQDWIPYQTVQLSKPYKTLAQIAALSPPLKKNPERPADTKEYLDHWLYYASFSPCWKERIDRFRGTVDRDKKRVVFPDDQDQDQEELFYALYNYEPDEQTQATREKMIPSF